MAGAGAVLLAWLVAILLPAAAGAGPWPRAPGELFVATTLEAGRDRVAGGMASDAGLYAEYGLGPVWTMELRAGRASGGDLADRYRAMVLLRPAIGTPGGQNRFAFSLGAGVETGFLPGYSYSVPQAPWPFFTPAPQRHVTVGPQPVTRGVLRIGLGAGRGFETLPGGRALPGWAAIELAADLRRGGTALRADATFGIRPDPRLMLVARLQTYRARGDALQARFVPSAVWELRPGLNLELGARIGLRDARDTRIMLGTWLTRPPRRAVSHP